MLEDELNQAPTQNMPYGPSASMFSGAQKQNLVEWQLDFRMELIDIERLLRCDISTVDSENNTIWIKNPNKSKVFLNDLGVNDVIRGIRMFLNKNKVLSFYREEEIKPRIRMLGHELRGLIYNNAEMYGIDNEYKENNYAFAVLTILDMIESAYRRAINGEERKGLGEARIVQQNDSPQNTPQNVNYYGGMNSQKRSKWYNPFTWAR